MPADLLFSLSESNFKIIQLPQNPVNSKDTWDKPMPRKRVKLVRWCQGVLGSGNRASSKGGLGGCDNKTKYLVKRVMTEWYGRMDEGAGP